MERREFLALCAAGTVISAPAESRGRFTRRAGDALIYEDPWSWHIRFDKRLVTVTNNSYPGDPAYTEIAFTGDRWTQITHEGHRQHPGRLLYPEIAGRIVLPVETELQPELGENLSAFVLAMLYAERDHPVWWVTNPGAALFQRAVASAFKKPVGRRCRIPDFVGLNRFG